MTVQEYISSKYGYKLEGEMPIILNHFGRRNRMLEMFRDLGFNKGVEVGTENGGYARDICEKVPGVKLDCIDPWVAYEEGGVLKDQQTMDKTYLKALGNLMRYDCRLIRATSIQAVDLFPDNSQDFVFIDGNHEYRHVLEDITIWAKKVRPGGVVYGHDFTESAEKNYGVIEAVSEYIRSNNIKQWFVLHTPRSTFVDCWAFVKV